VQNFLDVLRADHVPVADDYLEAWLSEEEKSFAEDFLQRSGISRGESIIALHPFTANAPRAWHLDNFTELANELQQKYDVRIIVFGGKRDAAAIEYLQKEINPRPVIAIGNTTIRESMSLLSRCSLLVCNDSGIMHLAAALHVPLVALFGPQSPAKFGPWGEKCRVIYKDFQCSPCRQKFFEECEPSLRKTPQCMEDISVEELLEEISRVANHLPCKS
jgi:heptosyltransferase-2